MPTWTTNQSAHSLPVNASTARLYTAATLLTFCPSNLVPPVGEMRQTGVEADMDSCDGNLISGNKIDTHGNECVEVKEGSSGNIIEYNVCSNQLDVESGCFCSRGDANTFRRASES